MRKGSCERRSGLALVRDFGLHDSCWPGRQAEDAVRDAPEEISRRLTPEEYQSVVAHAREVGLDRVEYDPAMTDEGGDGLLWR